MKSMNYILVPFSVALIPGEKTTPINYARMTYISKLAKYNLLPLFVSPGMTREMVDYLYNMSNGILLMGGLDVNPKHYGQTSGIHDKWFNGGQDETEIELIKRSIKDCKPLLGICRGCQILNVSLGGTLLKHVPDSFPQEDHGSGDGKTYDILFSQEKHLVLIDEKSKFYSIIQQNIVNTNTGHHQAVDRLGDNLRVAGKSSAGVIEVIEHTNAKHYCFGIQSHPEAEDPSFFEPVFRAFKDAVVVYSKSMPQA